MELHQENEGMVRVAINSYQRALFLKSVLESENIPAMVTSIDIIQPNAEGHMQVLINKENLDRALEVLSKVDLSYSDLPKEIDDENRPEINEILVPTDFSSHSIKACEFAFHLAKDLGCTIKILNAFYVPYYPSAMPFSNLYMLNASDEQLYKKLRDKVDIEVNNLMKILQQKIESGVIPDIPYRFISSEGLPEEEIVEYSRKYRPKAIVMGTRGDNDRDFNIVGSVTAEVMESARSSVFAIPEDTPFKELRGMKTLGFLTNFKENEFKAFDILMRFIAPYDIKVHMIHVSKNDDKWDEMKLAGVTEFLKEKYPLVETEYSLIDSSDANFEEVVDEFVKANNIDIIAMTKTRRSLLARVFNPGLSRRILKYSSTPILVLQRS